MKRNVFNPYLPAYEYIPDGEPHVFEGRVYIFGSHDAFGGEDYCPNDYVAWSAPEEDLTDWRYEGVIYRKDQDIHSKGKLPLYAPDVAKGLDGRYYLYYSAQNTSIISVAVCNTPAGKYEYYGDVKKEDGHVWGVSEKDWFEFDPAVLVDDDGRIWLYSGSGQNYNKRFGHPVVGAFVRELMPDMLTTIGEPRIIMPYQKNSIRKPTFFEGSSIRRINGIYYFIYAAMNVTGLNYCTSKYPDRDFVYQGCIHNTSDIGINGHWLFNAAYPIGNYHGSIEYINGKYYVFDHRQTNNNGHTRQGVAEEIFIDEKGFIKQVESTSCGLNGGPLPGKGTYPAYIACNLIGRKILGFHHPMEGPYITQNGSDREENPDSYIEDITSGSMVGFKYFDFDGLNKNITVSISGNACGTLQVLSKEKGALIAKLRIDIDTDQWTEATADMKALKGKQALFLKYRGKGSLKLKTFTFRN